MTLRLDRFPVQVPKGAAYAEPRTSAGRACPVTAASGFRPRLWDGFLEVRAGGALHEAQDIVGAEGSLIVAPVAGIVPQVARGMPGIGFGEKGGHYLWLRDGAGNLHYFAHLAAAPVVRIGQRVEAGALLGYLGRTGNAQTTCPHLHYAVTDTAGRKVNAYAALKPLYDAGGWQADARLGRWLVLAGLVLAGAFLFWVRER